MQFLQFGNDVISYEIRYNERKTTSIQIDETGITVIAPNNITVDQVEQIVVQKMKWIYTQLAEFEEMAHYEKPRQFISGEKLSYIGRNYRLKVQESDEATFYFKHGQFFATVPLNTPKDQYREMLYPLYKAWIKEKGKQLSEKRLKRFLIGYPHEPTGITIKEQEQRWGSCTSSNQLLLNWHLFLAPMIAIDYVIAHELAHLTVRDHSQAFWDTLKRIYPEYEEGKKWLKINGRKLYI
ncbi:SprT family zinc-dependent metalloprotease [Lederbergia citrisecunda]|uniref:M48 family metallopeptidase n=1 Tax=Lederbergia citrisecunda TaxID=2833583 RepID=UPI003D281F92